MRRYRWAVARELGGIGLQCVGPIFCRSDFHRARLVRILSESIQSHPGGNARWRTYRYGLVALVVVARFRVARLVWMEISKLHYLANCPFVIAEGLFTLP